MRTKRHTSRIKHAGIRGRKVPAGSTVSAGLTNNSTLNKTSRGAEAALQRLV
jgi:hypothetical protein